MDDKKSLVIIGFLIAIIIVLASFFLFLVRSGNTDPTAAYPLTETSQESTVSQTQESMAQEESESSETTAIKETTKAANEAKTTEEEASTEPRTIEETQKEILTTEESSAQAAAVPEPQTIETDSVPGKGMANREWIREYADDVGAYVTIYSLDETHVVFDTGAETASGKRNVLDETVATFIGSNKAEFEYMADDGTQHTGTIAFQNVEGREDVYEVILTYASPIWYPGDTGSVTELKAYN